MNYSTPTMQHSAPTSTGPRAALSLAALAPRPRSRGFIVAWTGSGKSTLAAALLEEYHRLYPRHVLYFLDPKHRFQPVQPEDGDRMLFPEGVTERRFGRRDGVPVIGRHLRKPRDPDESDAVYIVQDDTAIRALCAWLYDHATVTRPSLLFADESFDLMRGTRALPEFRRLIQQGREIGVGSLVINQRPANIDQTWISESQQLYVGRLIKPEDRERMIDSCAVADAWPVLAKPIAKYEWLYLDQEHERCARFRLRIGGSESA